MKNENKNEKMPLDFILKWVIYPEFELKHG